MPSTRALKTRIRSVKSTKQITKAMQMVAASKMRRAEEADKASGPYTRAANELLTYFSSQGITDMHPAFKKRPIKNRLIIAIASDKGLAGGYNSNVVKQYLNELSADRKAGIATQSVAVGRRVAQVVARIKDIEVVGIYEDLPDEPEGGELHAVVARAYDLFTKGEIDAVDVVYTQFVSGMNQQVVVKRVLPAGFETTDVTSALREARYEPSINAVLEGVTYRLVGAQVFQCYLDAKASEYAQRMVAMKNATDNASDLIDDLTLAMNKARQGAITQELAEISGGVEAMK